MSPSRIIILIISLFPILLPSQSIDLNRYTIFFDTQAVVYQTWLETIRLDDVFIVEGTEVMGNQVQLKLKFTTTNPDSIAGSWNAARTAYYEKYQSGVEAALFKKLLTLFDLSSNQATISICNSFHFLEKDLCLNIYIEDGNLILDDQLSGKGFDDKIPITLNLNLKEQSESSKAINWQLKEANIFDDLVEFVKNKFDNPQNCLKNKKPKFDVFYTGGSNLKKLNINVTGLCKEVLEEQEDLLICAFMKKLNQDCEAIKREDLEFGFYLDEKNDQILITCIIEGKYSNDYLLFHGKPIDMDDDFGALLESFGSKFVTELVLWIENKYKP